MDIQAMDRIVYNYTFEIDDIKRILFLYSKKEKEIKSIQFKKYSVNQRLLRLTKDFQKICKKLLRQVNIDSIETYLNYVSTLNIINAKIQKILQYEKGKSKCDRRKIKNLRKDYERAEKYINAYSGLRPPKIMCKRE